ncbi:macro domain-containing protein [Nitrospina gracilis]|uniref:macro domain-containing protein n=1 Tax=Nitrospina gracilis TaxID=35801 RepID=UPI001F3E37C1|nr:macro domain-containing protein [Nitrospina gracilis]MCF8721354.1 O-acetyl-ADP-ribose deacetylase (regulator of RNase III) [Nitrospina gracilis Nb-211]
MKLKINQSEIELQKGDITESDTDAVVNAANSNLTLGAGVAGAIRTKGGPLIQEECRLLGHCPVGEAVITSGGNLKADYVIHAVGPRYGEGGEDEKLRSATLSSLRLADDHLLTSISFPAISTGVFGFPIQDCARIMLSATEGYLSGKTGLRRVRFVLFDAKSLEVFEKQLSSMAEG